MLILNLDHLLMTAIGQRHAHQSAKLADAVVYVYYEIAYLKLLNLLQRKGHLAATCLVALQVVLVETVENLMVGKVADAQVVIGKALVQGVVNGNKRKRIVFTLTTQDVLQSFVLLLTVGQYAELIAFKHIVLKGLRKKSEVLVECGLHGDMKL